jgi:hypothetical protein
MLARLPLIAAGRHAGRRWVIGLAALAGRQADRRRVTELAALAGDVLLAAD